VCLGFSILLAPGHGTQATYCNTARSQQMHAGVLSRLRAVQAGTRRILGGGVVCNQRSD
jgi:hypothetical protein